MTLKEFLTNCSKFEIENDLKFSTTYIHHYVSPNDIITFFNSEIYQSGSIWSSEISYSVGIDNEMLDEDMDSVLFIYNQTIKTHFLNYVDKFNRYNKIEEFLT